MGYHFLPCERDQLYLLPPALQDWLPEGDLAWFILDAVAQMNLAAITRTYRADGWGQAAYEPAMMVALLLYAYCLGERSSRRIERLCQRDVAFRVITANQGPDHTTMARFRQTHEIELAKLFTQVLRLCAEAGLVAESRTGDDPFEDPTPPHGLSKKRLDLAYLEARSGYQTARSWV